MTKEEIDIQKEIEKYFTESTGFGKDKIRNFMDIVNKALKQKGERIEELENQIADIKANCDLAIEGRDIKIKELEQELTVQKDLLQEETNLHLHAEDYIKSLEQQIEKMKCCGNCKYSNQESAYSIVCKVGGVDKSDYINVDDNQVCDNWELRR